MKSTTAKSITPWVVAIIIFIFGFYLSSQRNLNAESQKITVSQELSIDHQEFTVKQKLADDFEVAFLKQYTPPVGCEVLNEERQSADCNQHLNQAKNAFKADFIKNRGLPKDTFENLKLSLK